MKTPSFGLALLLVSMLLTACGEEDNEKKGFSRNEYLGTWTCTEESGPNAPQLYSVRLEAGSGSSDLLLYGLANQGEGFVLTAEALAQGFNIPLQTVDGLTVTGTAVTGDELSPIDLLFDLDDGSGAQTTEARLTR